SYQNSFKNNTLSRLSKDTLNLGIVSYDYNSAKEKEMSLGLDLKGGMNVILQVSIKDLLSDLADKSQDPDFLEVLERTNQRQKASNAEYIDDFFVEYNTFKQ